MIDLVYFFIIKAKFPQCTVFSKSLPCLQQTGLAIQKHNAMRKTLRKGNVAIKLSIKNIKMIRKSPKCNI